ncbi:MAG: hypothetical protein IKI11_01335 [Neisseriaceae bacterium]|nr:hypothetical protein [Neisseriaceae bacterium]
MIEDKEKLAPSSIKNLHNVQTLAHLTMFLACGLFYFFSVKKDAALMTVILVVCLFVVLGLFLYQKYLIGSAKNSTEYIKKQQENFELQQRVQQTIQQSPQWLQEAREHFREHDLELDKTNARVIAETKRKMQEEMGDAFNEQEFAEFEQEANEIFQKIKKENNIEKKFVEYQLSKPHLQTIESPKSLFWLNVIVISLAYLFFTFIYIA